MRFRVYYEDTDCGGIVYHANYLKYCERARSEVFFANDLSPCDQQGFFVVRSLQAQFFTPGKLGDTLEVLTKLKELKKVSVILEQEVIRVAPQSARLFCMQIKLGFISQATHAPTPISAPFVSLLKSLL
ncbi:YbgC/FadM family acyl-CoA thioesterase [Helicobacter felis]|uniref:Thioesterase family protein n=1 Tax=Helicobacter felis (strain ATCC 49179 / CCUG 28539 / NCTC 12436 / CS1) TaxID=936155 RepID=E7A8M8_HELFC|nr:YbgC/FadM family acyl-CoA thioesterase [Helicobacter felis]CBY82365.1 thioesterase family protein [Helicobacter felis ATCC 49179]